MRASRRVVRWTRLVIIAGAFLLAYACGSNTRSGAGAAPPPGGGTSGAGDAGTVEDGGGSGDSGSTGTGGSSSGGAGGGASGGQMSGCQGLMPTFTQAVEHRFDLGTHAQCMEATSSPSGQVALGTAAASSFPSFTFQLFSSDGSVAQGSVGAIVNLNDEVIDSWFNPTSGGYQGLADTFAGPSPVSGQEARVVLRTWDPAGNALGDLVTISGALQHAISTAPDGAGGSVLLSRAYDPSLPSPFGATRLTYVDGAGHVTHSVELDRDALLVQVAWGSRHVLAIVPGSAGSSARWFDDTGAPLTPWFDLPALPGFTRTGLSGFAASTHLLVDGRVAVSDGHHWVAAVADGAASADAAPDWLVSRPDTRLATVRDGRGYALLPLSPSPLAGPLPDANADEFEIVTAAGQSCGKVSVPPAAAVAGVQRSPTRLDVGQDGSTFRLEFLSGPALDPSVHCSFRWWPGLLH